MCRSSWPTPFDALRGKRVPSQVSTADVFPTSSTSSGPPRPQVQGRSLAGLLFDPESDDDVPAYGEAMASNIQFGWSPLHALRTPRYKYIDAPRAGALRSRPRTPGSWTMFIAALSRRGPADEGRARSAHGRDEPGRARAAGRRPRQGDHGTALGPWLCRRAGLGPESLGGERTAGRPQGQARRLHGRHPGGGAHPRGKVHRGRDAARSGAPAKSRPFPRPCCCSRPATSSWAAPRRPRPRWTSCSKTTPRASRA